MKCGPSDRWVARAIKNSGRVYRAMFYVATVFFLFMVPFPFYWLLIITLTPNRLIGGMGLLPKGSSPEVFVTMFKRVLFHLYVFNSFMLGIMTTVTILSFASLAGYIFGRLRFPGKGALMLGILTISYFPPTALLIPLFKLLTGSTAISFGAVTILLPDLFDTSAPIVFPFSALFLSLSTFTLTTFCGQIPDGLEDVARIEGTTRLGTFLRVIMLLSAPGVVTAGVLMFISAYNEFFFSLIMSNDEADSWTPIVTDILKYQGWSDAPYNSMAVASIVEVLSVVTLVIIAQERIVSGLTAGALRE